jgi:hypothetical protein
VQQRLWILGFGPVDEAAAVNVAGGGQFFFGALEGFFFEDGLRDRSRQAAAFQIG